MDLLLKVSQRVNEQFGEMIGVFELIQPNTRESNFSFDQRREGAAALAVHHQVDFRVADALLLCDDWRTPINRNSVRNKAFVRPVGRYASGSKALAQLRGDGAP